MRASGFEVRRPAYNRGLCQLTTTGKAKVHHCAGVLSVTNQIKTMTSKIDSLPAFAKTATALSILAAISSQTLAAETEPKDPLLIVITTATTTPITASESLASVTVIDKDDIEKQQPQEMTELLAGQPGVDITTNGGYGKTSSVSIRGSNGDGTKLLVDGVPLRSVSSGDVNWQYLPTALLDRVEVVRGPKATLYGSSASGGVVQVFLPTAGQQTDANITVGAGSFNTQSVDVDASGSFGNAHYLVALGRFETDGTPVKEDGDNMPFSNDHALIRLGYDFDSGAYASVLGLLSQGKSYYEDSTYDYHDFENQVLATTFGLPILPFWNTEIQLQESRDNDEYFADSGIVDQRFYNSKSQSLRWNNNIWVGNNDFVIGAEVVEDSVDSQAYNEDPSVNRSVFAQSISHFGPLSLQLNARSDDYNKFGQHSTGGVALGYRIDNSYKARVSYGTAFKAPDFNDLYWPGSGNPDIKPEQSESLEFGVRGDFSQAYWDLALFQADYNDLIGWADDGTGTYRPFNTDKARIRGIEFAAGLKLSEWNITYASSLMDPVTLTEGSNYGNRLAYRSETSERIDVDRLFENASLGITISKYGDRYTSASNSTLLPGYTLINLRASYDFAKDWSAKFTVKNALDKNYVTARNFGGWDYQNPGVGAFLTVNYSAL